MPRRTMAALLREAAQIALLGLASGFLGVVPSYAHDTTVAVTVTASHQIRNIPAAFADHEFTLSQAWRMLWTPGFSIENLPRTATLVVDRGNRMPTLRLVDSAQGLARFFYCRGLALSYTSATTASASIVFEGEIDKQHPGTEVTCTCTGPACSTSAKVQARGVEVTF